MTMAKRKFTDFVPEYDFAMPVAKRAGRGGGKLGPIATAARDCPVGASFFIPGASTSAVAKYLQAGKDRGQTYVTRAVTEDGETGVRVWRTA